MTDKGRKSQHGCGYWLILCIRNVSAKIGGNDCIICADARVGQDRRDAQSGVRDGDGMATIVDLDATRTARTARTARYEAQCRLRLALDAAIDRLDMADVTRGEMVEAVEAITAAMDAWGETVEA